MERDFLEGSGTLWVPLQTSPLSVSNQPDLVLDLHERLAKCMSDWRFQHSCYIRCSL
jgi:hypothetical protein